MGTARWPAAPAFTAGPASVLFITRHDRAFEPAYRGTIADCERPCTAPQRRVKNPVMCSASSRAFVSCARRQPASATRDSRPGPGHLMTSEAAWQLAHGRTRVAPSYCAAHGRAQLAWTLVDTRG